MMQKTFYVEPVAKPRMTQRDKWKKRPCVQKYYAFKDQLNEQKNDFVMPESNYWIIFYITMPKSWSQAKKLRMCGMPHKQKPDKDNIEKAFLDALCKEDSNIWDGRTTKRWAAVGYIDIFWGFEGGNAWDIKRIP